MDNRFVVPKAAAVLTAAGGSMRMNGADKIFLPLCGIPVLARSMLAFQNAECIADIIIVCRENNIEAVKKLAEDYNISKLSAVTTGGSSRAESVLYGIACLMRGECPDVIAVHDGARPLISTEKINEVVAEALKSGAAILAIPVKDTVKKVNDNVITGTQDRSSLYSAQTPQAFNLNLYRKAVNLAAGKGYCVIEDTTDDSLLFEMAGIPVSVINGEYGNIKITTPEDIISAEAFLLSEARKPNLSADKKNKIRERRIGHGYDVHRFSENRRLILCGVDIPHEFGLLGHSDADVAVHAIMDALLGALALGDIGKHFPDSSPLYKDADSMKLLSEVVSLIHKNNYEIGNLDVTIVAEKPKLAMHIDEMRKNIASACKVHVACISVKATTEEGLGIAGKGIAAHAVCLLNFKP